MNSLAKRRGAAVKTLLFPGFPRRGQYGTRVRNGGTLLIYTAVHARCSMFLQEEMFDIGIARQLRYEVCKGAVSSPASLA